MVMKRSLMIVPIRIAVFSVLVLNLWPAPWSLCLAAGPRVAPLPVEAVTDMKSTLPYGRPAFSPDGEWLAYELQDPLRIQRPVDARYANFTANGVLTSYLGCDVWVTNIRTGESRNITSGNGTSVGPVWSPDGQYLAFLSDRGGEARVWLWVKDSGRLQIASNAKITISGVPVSSLVWTSDSKSIIFGGALQEGMSIADAIDLMDPSAKDQAAAGKDDNQDPLVYTAQANLHNEADKFLHDGMVQQKETGQSNRIIDVIRIEVATGKTDHLLRQLTPCPFHLSPDGQSVAFLDFKRDDFEGGFGHIFDLVRIDLRNGRANVLVGGIKASWTWSWSPDGHSVVYALQGEYFLVPADGGAPRQLTHAEKVRFDTDQAPIWDQSGTMLFAQSKSKEKDILWGVRIADGATEPIVELTDFSLEGLIHRTESGDLLAQGRWVYTLASDRHTHQTRIYRIDIKTHQFQPILGGEEEMISGAQFSPDGERVIWTQQDALHPRDMWSSDAEFKHPQRITHNNPGLDEYAFGQTRLISWRTAEGVELHGGLILPSDYHEGQRYPIVVCVYGGVGISGDIHRFSGSGLCDFNLQLLATRGYAVLFADSSITENGGKPMQEIAQSVLPGIDQAIALGIADPNRIGVMGQSYGGYSTLALIVQSPQFKAAVSIDGMSDLFSSYSVLAPDGMAYGVSWSENGQGNLGGSPWQYRERYLENSPFFYLDRTEAAVLLIHGTADETVQPWLADQTFVGLRRLGREVTYVKYRNGGHASSEWSHADQVDFCNRVIAWYDTHLKPPLTPETAHP